MKRNPKMRGVLSCLLALVLALGATPLAVYADEGEGTTNAPAEVAQTDWYVSRSKTATELDENYMSQVTLSLPSAEEELSSDVVFVLDTSDCVGEVMNQVSGLVTQLETAQEKTNADIKVGVVVFKGSALPMFDGKLVSAEEAETTLNKMIQEVKAAAEKEKEKVVLSYLNAGTDFIYKGSNLHSGLLGAQALLKDDGAVKDSRKYVVTVTDGMTYYWNDKEGNVYAVYNDELDPNNWHKVNCLFYAWQSAHDIGSGYTLPSGFEWNDYISDVRSRITADGDQFVSNLRQVCEKTTSNCDSARYFEGSGPINTFTGAGFQYVPLNEGVHHALGIERSVVACLDTYQEMVTAGYQCYTLNPDYGTNTFPGLFTSKLNEMANKNDIDFTSIQNDILYAVDAGSKVEDVIGNDFTLDVDSLSIYVGDDKLAKQAVANANNTWAFGDTTNSDRFTVAYNADTKTLTWNINEPITNFACVQLKYNVKLTNLPTQADSYTSPTNEWAKLYPKDSTDAGGRVVEFPKPEVSYTIYALNYDANGGSGAPDSEVNCTGKFTVSDTVPTRDGYVFAGWNTVADGSGTNCAAGSGIERSEDSLALTLYAQWNKLVTVSFDLCGHGGANIPSQTFVSGNKASEPTAPKEDGWVFGGWYTENGCQYRFSFDSAVTSDITLYAKWDRVATVVSAPVATPTPSPAPAATPSPAPAAAATKTATVKNAAIPQTSDVFPMEGLLALLAVGAVGFGAAGWLRKKHH